MESTQVFGTGAKVPKVCYLQLNNGLKLYLNFLP